MVPAILHSFSFDSLKDGHLPKPDTKGWSLPFFSHFLCFSLRWTTPQTGHQGLVPAVLQSFSFTLYKMDTSLNRTPRVDPCRSSVIFFSHVLQSQSSKTMGRSYRVHSAKLEYPVSKGATKRLIFCPYLPQSGVHSYNTRRSGVFQLLHCRTNLRKLSICFQGPKFFNSLSVEIENATSIVSFFRKLKAFPYQNIFSLPLHLIFSTFRFAFFNLTKLNANI